MARYLLIVLLVALVCVMQAHSAPAEESSSSTVNPLDDIVKNVQEGFNQMLSNKKLNETLSNFGENFNKAIQNFKPTLENLQKEGQKFLENAGTMMKTEEAKKP